MSWVMKTKLVPVCCVHLQHFVLQARFGHGVERAERLVHQHHFGLQRQRAGDLHALLHAAGELPGMVRGILLKTDHLQRLPHPPIDLGAVELAFDAQRDIARDAAPLQQRVRIILEHDDHADGRAGHGGAAKADRAARRRHQAAEQAQQRRFAGARRSDDGQELAGAHVERQPIDDQPALTVRKQFEADSVAFVDLPPLPAADVAGRRRYCSAAFPPSSLRSLRRDDDALDIQILSGAPCDTITLRQTSSCAGVILKS